jgi:hypothetical protein
LARAGSGSKAVYTYYFESDRARADGEGRQTWACKIGSTDRRRPLDRIREQTQSPVAPVPALLLRTDTHKVLEKYLQLWLEGRGRKVMQSAGDEWYETNPDEVLALALEVTEWFKA